VKLVLPLKVQPELGPSPKPISEPNGGVRRDRPLAGKKLGYTVRGNVERASKLGGVHLQEFELVFQDFAWVNGWASHPDLLVVVDDFDAERRFGILGPLETDTPLGVDSDAVST
jgi:hypothetical protein